MMKWYQRSFFQPPQIDPNRNEESFRLQPIELDSDKPPFSTLAQFFLAEHVLYDVPELVTVIPIPNREMEDIAFREIAVHFHNVSGVYIDDQLHRLQLRHIRKDSKHRFQTMLKRGMIATMVRQLYFLGQPELLEHRYVHLHRRNQVHYEVRRSEIKPLTHIDPDTMRCISFIQHTFGQTEGVFTVFPQGWTFRDELKDLEAIRLLSHMFDSLFITVDADDHRVLYMQVVSCR